MTNKEKYFGSSKDIAKWITNIEDPYCTGCPISGTICENRYINGEPVMSCQDTIEKWLDQEFKEEG